MAHIRKKRAKPFFVIIAAFRTSTVGVGLEKAAWCSCRATRMCRTTLGDLLESDEVKEVVCEAEATEDNPKTRSAQATCFALADESTAVVEAAMCTSSCRQRGMQALLPRVLRERQRPGPEIGLAGSRLVSHLTELHSQRQGLRGLATHRALGPSPVWDPMGPEAAIGKPGTNEVNHPRPESGSLHRVVWVCWTGHNPMPAHLRLCLQSIRRNAGLPVILVTPANLLQYVPEPHPVYPFLHLAHRADYLRCYLLHHYGGIYLDVDTICLQSLSGLFDKLAHYEAVGYDGSQWMEYIGISCMGPFRPHSDVTTLWYNALHGKLSERAEEAFARQTDIFYWQEILRDIFVPVSLVFKTRICQALQALNPEQEQLWSVDPFQDVLRLTPIDEKHILILNNANYGKDLGHLSAEQILGGPAVLSQLLRHALGVVDDASREAVLAAVNVVSNRNARGH